MMKSWVYSFHEDHNFDPALSFKQNSISLENRVKLLSFLNQVETDGLGASCKFFTVTYNTFASMFGLVITYAIVVSQIS